MMMQEAYTIGFMRAGAFCILLATSKLSTDGGTDWETTRPTDSEKLASVHTNLCFWRGCCQPEEARTHERGAGGRDSHLAR